MTTKHRTPATLPKGFLQLPEAPPREDMNNWKYFNSKGTGAVLAQYFGKPETTLIMSDAYIAPEPTRSRKGLVLPDLLIAFGVDPQNCDDRNGYVISDQGKPPDFVLEIGSPSTGRRDVTVKRDKYAELGVTEYWRFDSSGGDYHGAPLAGNRLTEGAYRPVPVRQLDAETWQGYSEALGLWLRWDHGQLGWHDPETGLHIPTLSDWVQRVEELEAELERRRQQD